MTPTQNKTFVKLAGSKFFWSGLICAAIFLNLLLYLLYKGVQNSPQTGKSAGNRDIPNVVFSNVTIQAGINFVHNNAATGQKLLPETMGPGVAFVDLDNDTFPDLLFVNGTGWPGRNKDSTKETTCALYRNDGKGNFTDVTKGSGLETPIYGMGVAVGDFNNDSKPDILITGVGQAVLFQNLGSMKFQEVTANAGVSRPVTEWSTSAAWLDYNNDGLLDLFICNYVLWSREIDQKNNYKLPGLQRAYGPPMNFEGTYPCLYKNNGNGTFTDVSASAGIQINNPATGRPLAKSLGVSAVDLDRDGWIDIIVANDTVANFVFHNEKNGTFRETGASTGLAYDPYGNTRGAMGIDTGRFQGDETLGISIGNFANEMTALYVSKQNPLMFSDEAISRGIGNVSRHLLTFGVFFFDYDLDGLLDLLTVNGHIEPDIQKVYPNQSFYQSAQLFWNSGQNGFMLVPPEKCGPDLVNPIAGRGSAYADMDQDGDLDVIITRVGDSPVLLRNQSPQNNNWVRIKLVGSKWNRDAIGAWVHLKVGNSRYSQQVMPTRGYLSQSEMILTFGLGKAEKIDEASVTWGNGPAIPVPGLELRKLNVLQQGK